MQASSSAPALLARSARLKLFVMVRRTLNAAALPDMLDAHLRWMIEEERRGSIFLSGPIAPRVGASPFDGLTIIHAATLADAESLAAQDPFVRAGIVAFDMREWTVNEGCLRLNVTLSDSNVTL